MNFEKIGFNTGQAIGDFLYCSALKLNGLFKVNIFSGETFFLDYFPEEDFSGVMLFRESHIYKRNIIFVPQSANKIAIYNIDSKEFKQIKLDEKAICASCLVDVYYMS